MELESSPRLRAYALLVEAKKVLALAPNGFRFWRLDDTIDALWNVMTEGERAELDSK